LRIGVLALQGDVEEHSVALARVGATPVPVKNWRQVSGIEGLVIPGGESTTFSQLVDDKLYLALKDAIGDGLAVLATCAGLIYLAKQVSGGTHYQRFLEVLDVGVRRNAYGDQRFSFEAKVHFKPLGTDVVAPFIRSPRIVSVGDGVEVIATLEDEPVGVRQGRVIGLAFHPELTEDTRIHEYFLSIAKEGT
jgi:5'-phosphate synthase pdxT subunit